MKKILFIFYILIASYTYSFEKYLTVCAIFRDDAPYLKEWIDFHISKGVEHFYLYNNLSKDSYREVLSPYINKNIVSLTDWPHEHSSEDEWVEIQCESYIHCVNHIKDKVKWCAFIDTDEFLFSPVGQLSDILKKYEKYSGVVVNWVLYGTSNVEKISPEKKMLDCLLMRAKLHHLENRWVKTIAKPKFIKGNVNCHTFNYSKGYAVNERKEKSESAMTKKNSVKFLRINHYRTRDVDFFLNVKKSRSKTWSNEQRLNQIETLNEVYDPILSSGS